jgi:hypothetical protein
VWRWEWKIRIRSTSIAIAAFVSISAQDSLPRLVLRHTEFQLQQFVPHALPAAHKPVKTLPLDLTAFFQALDISGCASLQPLQSLRDIFGLEFQTLDLIALDQGLQSQMSQNLLISLGFSRWRWLFGNLRRCGGWSEWFVEVCEFDVEGVGARFVSFILMVGLSWETAVFFEEREEVWLL